MSDIQLYAIDFFNSLCPSEQMEVLALARKAQRRKKMSSFSSDREIKQATFLLERLDKFLDGEPYSGYDCDIVTCDKPAKFYNANVDAFYCQEHN